MSPADCPERPFRERLPDGTVVLVRPVQPDDREHLSVCVRRLSPQTRFQRFHRVIHHLTDDELRYLTEIDYQDHVAWAAVDPNDGDCPGMGIARFVRFSDAPDIAEVAVTVVDRHQRRGVGRLLLAALSRSALRCGITQFHAQSFSCNAAVLRLVQLAGGRLYDVGEGLVEIRVPVPDAA